MDRFKENNQRLGILYNQHHSWLLAVGFNITKDKDMAEDLVSDLYVYLGEKVNPATWYLNSFNLMYCRSFIMSRFLNKIKVGKRNTTLSENYDDVEEEYDVEYDEKLEKTYNSIVDELKKMEYTKQWASSKLAQLYWFNEKMTLEKLASEIKISKSTAFLNCKKVKKHIQQTIDNPFRSNS
jgi:DNA-directed RNA polymerase specialized sigma24 family protein